MSSPRFLKSLTWIVIAGLLGVLFVGCRTDDKPRATPDPPAGTAEGNDRGSSQISFISDREGNLEIYLLNLDGDELINLTNSPGTDLGGGWAPDGDRLVFTSDRDGMPSLYILDVAAVLEGAQESTVTRLTDFPSGNPTWSPDGEWIAFLGDREGQVDIFLIRPDGTSLAFLEAAPGPGGSAALVARRLSSDFLLCDERGSRPLHDQCRR